MIQVPWRSDGGLLPSMLLLRYLQQTSNPENTCSIDGFACGNGSLPDLLRLCAIEKVTFQDSTANTTRDSSSSIAQLPSTFRWEGSGGARLFLHLAVSAATPEQTSRAGQSTQESTQQLTQLTQQPNLHHGALPTYGHGHLDASSECFHLINVARLEDAQAVMQSGPGADWPQILKALGLKTENNTTLQAPVSEHHQHNQHNQRNEQSTPDNGCFHVWNPLPIQRYCPVTLAKPSGSPPWGLCDDNGKRFPVQITEGAYGPELLSMIPLGPLECKRLQPYAAPVSTSYWEVNDSIIDNGLLRAELNERGSIKRLSINGQFIDISGMLCQPSIHHLPLDGKCSVQVLESGPIRAQISCTIASSHGTYRCSYELYAHEDFLRISISWSNPSQPLRIDHASSYRRAPLECAAELAPWRVEQAASAYTPQPHIQQACHWARLSEYRSHCGLAVASETPMPVSAHAGHLYLGCNHSLRYALMGNDSKSLGNPGRVLQHCALPGRSAGKQQSAQAAAFFLSEADDLVPLWIRSVEQNGDTYIEMLLSEQAGQRGKAYLLPVEKGIAGADRVDVNGNSLRPLHVTKERDGFEIDYLPYEVFLIKWQFC